MIDVRIIKAKLKIEEEVKETKVWLDQKEIVEYTNWKSLPENEKDRSAVEKVVAKLKLEDEVWLQKEADLVYQEIALKTINMINETLQNTLRAMSSHPEITLDYFQEVQGVYLEEFLKDINLED